jgi:hypothetical protein
VELDYLSVAAAAVAALVLSGVWYSVFGERLSELHPAYGEGGGAPSGSDVVVELVRNLVVGTVVAGLISRLPVDTWPDAILLGLALWVGFPLVLLPDRCITRRCRHNWPPSMVVTGCSSSSPSPSS